MLASLVFRLRTPKWFSMPIHARAGATAIALFLATPEMGASPNRSVQREPFSTGSSSWDGYAEFVRLAQNQLGQGQVVLTKRLDYSALNARDAILIVHPKQKLDEGSLSAFLVEGGRVALLDDYGEGEHFLLHFGIENGPAPTDPYETLGNNPNLPVASPSIQFGDTGPRGRHPVTAGVERVMTNHPRTFKHPDLTTVLDIVDKRGTAYPLAVTGVIAQRGRLFALADPSVFINFMLRYPDNRKLAAGLLRYLSSPVATSNETEATPPRQARLFIVTNAFEEVGRYGHDGSFKDKLDTGLDEALDALKELSENGMSKELTLALSLCAAGAIFTTLFRRALTFPPLLRPSYSFAGALASQFGPTARAAVLRSRSASPVLALMELDSTIREAITRRWDMDGGAPPAHLADAARARGFSSENASDMEAILKELARYGDKLTQKKPIRVSPRTMSDLHERTLRLLKLIETNKMLHGSK